MERNSLSPHHLVVGMTTPDVPCDEYSSLTPDQLADNVLNNNNDDFDDDNKSNKKY